MNMFIRILPKLNEPQKVFDPYAISGLEPDLVDGTNLVARLVLKDSVRTLKSLFR